MVSIRQKMIEFSCAIRVRSRQRQGQRFAVRTARFARVDDDERRTGRRQKRIANPERPTRFRIESAGAGKALFFLIMADRCGQGRARLARHFAVKEMAFSKFLLSFSDLFIPQNGAARK